MLYLKFTRPIAVYICWEPVLLKWVHGFLKIQSSPQKKDTTSRVLFLANCHPYILWICWDSIRFIKTSVIGNEIWIHLKSDGFYEWFWAVVVNFDKYGVWVENSSPHHGVRESYWWVLIYSQCVWHKLLRVWQAHHSTNGGAWSSYIEIGLLWGTVWKYSCCCETYGRWLFPVYHLTVDVLADTVEVNDLLKLNWYRCCLEKY